MKSVVVHVFDRIVGLVMRLLTQPAEWLNPLLPTSNVDETGNATGTTPRLRGFCARRHVVEECGLQGRCKTFFAQHEYSKPRVRRRLTRRGHSPALSCDNVLDRDMLDRSHEDSAYA